MPADKKKGLGPTVFDPSALPSERREPHQAMPVGQPTAIPGEARKRIFVTVQELQALSPATAPNVCQMAAQLLQAVVAEKLNEREVILWGHSIQVSYSELVNQMLKLSQSSVLGKVQGYLNRMITLLSAIDVLAVCGYDSSGIFGQFTKSMNTRIDTPQELWQAQNELGQLVQYMSKALNDLLNLKVQIEQNSSLLNQIDEELEASAVAALFLSNHFNGSPFAQIFMDRSMSLTQTLLQIRQEDAVRKIQIDQPLMLISLIQNVALVSMPGLLSSISSIITLTQSKAISPTEAGEINYQLQETINQLRS